MTMNYCGRCGAANGTAARFCRQCGAELHSQAAFSSASAPLNVEFSARNAAIDRQRETKTEVTESSVQNKPDTAKLGKAPTTAANQTPAQTLSPNDDENSDPKAISESLKRLRASGPLIVEAVKKKQERINQIIAESIESRSENSNANQSATESKSASLTQSSQSGKTQVSKSAGSQSVVNSSPTQRRNTGQISASTSARLGGSTANSGGSVPHGPSSVLAQASGLGKNSNFGSKLRIGLIAAIVVIFAASFPFLRDKFATPAKLLDAGRNLLSAEEQSAYLVRLGQRDREKGHYDLAIGYFRDALNLRPNNPETHFLLAQTYVSAGQTDDALKEYQSLLRLAPEHLEGRLQVADIHRSRGNWTVALQEYQRIIALDQNSPQAAVALEAMESYESNKPESAIARTRRPRKAVKGSPISPPDDILVDTQVPLIQQRAFTAAGIKPPTTKDSSEDRPDPRAAADGHKKLGLRYFNVREYRAAINEFLAALRLTPEDKDLYYFLGSSYYGLGQLALAHDYYKRVDSGNYVGVAQSGAARTEKAARDEYRRREVLKNEPQTQVKNDSGQKRKESLNNSIE